MLPTVAAFLCYMKGLAPKNRVAMAFGSYGWGGQSIGQVQETLKECSFTLMDPIKIQYIPTKEDINEIKNKLKGVIK